MHFKVGGFPFYSSASYQLIWCCVNCESGMQIHSPACFSFVFRFSNYGSSPEELNHALLTSGWREGLGVRRSCSVLLGVALARREAFWHVILCQKPSHLSQEKSLSFLCFFFFFFSSKTADISSQRCFAYKPRWYHKKKKNSPESNRTDKLRPLGNSCLYFFIFLFFFFLSSVQDTYFLAISYSL